MEIKFDISRSGVSGNLIITEGNARISEDVIEYRKDQGWFVRSEYIDQFIQVAFDMAKFNHISDLDMVKRIAEIMLSDSEKKELAESLTETTT